MSDLGELATRVRIALGVNESHEGTTISEGILRAINRLLRDYNFPKSVKEQEYVLSAGAQSFALPAGFKRELLIRWRSTTSDTYSDPLRKREGITPPSGLGYPKYFWLVGTTFNLDLDFGLEYAGMILELYYQSMASKDNLWMLTDFEDAVFTYSVYRLAADFRKPEVMQAFAPLWQEDQQSLAIYANELEFNQLDMVQREARGCRLERYPIS